MRKTTKRFFAILLAVTMLVGLLPTLTLAGSAFDGEGKASESVYVYTEADNAALQNDVFAKIENVKAEAATQLGGIGKMTERDYIDLVPQVISAIESSATYVPGTLQQNGSFLVWETTTGLPCCYDPRMEAELHNTENEPTPADIAKAEEQAAAILADVSTRGGGPTSMDIGLIQPYWESSSNYEDSSFNNYSPQYKAMQESIAAVTGGNTVRYTLSNATVDNIGATMSQCGLVMFDSHGTTDYSGSGGDYTSQANCSYLCLTTNSGVTSADTAAQTGEFGTFYHALTGSGYAYVSGTCIANHMPTAAPNSYLYMGICLGMATDGMHKGLRNKGVEVVYGYSQSVTFAGDMDYMNNLNTSIKNGDDMATAVAAMKQAVGVPDPYTSSRPAYPIVVSSEDPYPGHGNVDAAQTVYSTWSLFGEALNITAVSNNTAWGTVAISGYTITATPAEGYFTAGYEILSGTATLTQDGNIFRVRPETDCTVQINFAAKTPAVVTYMAGDTVIGSEGTFLSDDVTLPLVSTEFVDWTFIGWMDHTLGTTMEKPVFYKPGATYTVFADEIVLRALYKHIDGDGSMAYELVEPGKGVMDGVYVITSGTTDAMYVMNGVSGSSNIESNSQGYTAFASTGIDLDDNALRDVAEDYLFLVEERDGGYSVQSVSEESFLAVFESYLWVRETYESAYCNWTITPTASGVTLMCTASTSWPYLNWSGSKWAAASSSSSLVQLWKEAPSGDVYYSTAPVVEEHDHELVYTAELAPTCGVNGHTAYYQCSVCFKYFSDAAGENEITLASTVIPATGSHTFGAFVANNNGTHTHTCSVCGAAETEDCVYESVVTVPTPTEQGFTTYTCTVCGYTYVGNYTSPTGMDFTIVFNVPLECEQPDDMICNNLSGVTLPVIAAPQGYTFLGWVEQPYDNVDARPAEIYSGHYVTNADVTLYALFKYVEADGSGETAFEIVSAQPDDWTGNYVITYNNTTALYAMKGMDAGVSYEDTGNGSAVAYASTGMTLTEDVLTDVADAFVFHVAQESSGKYSIQSIDFDSYVGITGGTLTAIGDYESSTCDYALTLMDAGNVSAYMSTAGSWPYIAFTTGSNKFWCLGSTSGIYFWKEVNAGTPYWTTIIGEPDPGVDYTVTFTTPNGVTAPAPMTVNNMTGAVLPTVTAPEGYTFLGWVTADYDNVDVKPEGILHGRYRPQSDVTLKALFKYKVLDGTIAYELVTEQLADWTGNYVITCNKDEASMIVMHGVGADMTYEHQDSYGMYELADSGLTLEDNVLYDAGENYVFALEARDEGYSIQNLGSENYVGRYCTSADQSSQLYSFSAYDPTFCRWTFEYGNPGATDVVDNVLIHNVVDPNLDQYYQYLGCGWYYHFAESSDNYPYFWVDGPGNSADSDVFYMFMWKETEAGTNYWTTIIEDLPEEDLVDVYFVDQDDNASAYAYAFGPNGENAPFPGELLTVEGVDENGDNFYKITLDRSVYTNVIFSGGDNTTQTADLPLGDGEYMIYYINNHTGYGSNDIWPAPAVVVEPTCTEEGSITYTGMFTGTEHVTTTEALGHLPGEAVQENYVEPTETEDGGYDMVVYCQRCNAELSREHTVLPHPEQPVEPIETEALHIYNSISVGTDMVITFTARKNDLTNYSNFWIEVVKHNPDGDVAYTYNPDVMTESASTWTVQFKNIYAKEMGIDVEARLYAEDAEGQIYMSPARNANIRDYLGGRLVATNNKVEQRVLAADMLNYGAAAQMFTGFETDHLVNEELTADQLAKLHQYETTGLPLVEKTNTNYSPEGASNILFTSVTLGNEVLLNLTIRLAEGTEGVQVLVKDHETGAVVTTLDTTFLGSTFSATFNGIGADAMRTEFDLVTIVNGVETGNTRTWSVEAYVGEIRNGNLPLKTAMANALLTYGDSAAAYFAAQ